MPEVAGDAAVLVDPLDPDAIADGVEAAITRRGNLVTAGMARVSRRGWSDVAGETWEVYQWAAHLGDGT